MKPLWFVPLLALCLAPPPSRAGWGSGGCSSAGPVGPMVRVQPRITASVPGPRYTWQQSEGTWYLYDRGVQVGGYQEATDIFRWYDPTKKTWSEPSTPPWRTQQDKPAEKSFAKPVAIPNFGLDLEHLNNKGEQYSLSGEQVSKQTAEAVFGDGRIPDDAGKHRIVVIGPDHERKPVLDALASHSALAPWKDKTIQQGFEPGHWALRPGFVTTGHPTIYLEDGSGKVLFRQDNFEGGPEALADALRKASPDYDPKKDPNGKSPVLPGLPDLSQIPLWVWLCGGVLLLAFLLPPKVEVP